MVRILPPLAGVLSLTAFVAAQSNCSGSWPPGGTAFIADCPCGQVADPQLYFQGTSRIGSIQRFAPVSTGPVIPAAFLVVGLAPAAPTPIPMGLVVCGTSASQPMTPIQSIAIDPLLIAPIAFFQNGVEPPTYHPLPYYLFIPYLPLAVGATMHAQYFAQEMGTGHVPFAASHTIGFTIQP